MCTEINSLINSTHSVHKWVLLLHKHELTSQLCFHMLCDLKNLDLSPTCPGFFSCKMGITVVLTS